MFLVLVSGLFLIELACAIVFIGVYGLYLLFKETELYTEEIWHRMDYLVYDFLYHL